MYDRPNRRSSRSNRQSPRNKSRGPNQAFKQPRRQREHAKEVQAMRDGNYDQIPTTKHSDKYLWY